MNLHSTCDAVFKKLLSEVGAQVHHLKVFMPEDKDIFWNKGVLATDTPTELQSGMCRHSGEEYRNLKRSQIAEIEDGYSQYRVEWEWYTEVCRQYTVECGQCTGGMQRYA